MTGITALMATMKAAAEKAKQKQLNHIITTIKLALLIITYNDLLISVTFTKQILT